MIVYNYYKYDISKKKLLNDTPTKSIGDDIDLFGKALLSVYLKEQEGKKGINKIGNVIKKDVSINELLKLRISENNSYLFIKAFENRRSFNYVFLEGIEKYYPDNINFIILNEYFGRKSKLVDNTFIKLEQVEEYLNTHFKHFDFRDKKINLNTTEILSFKGYRIESITTNTNKLAKLVKL